MKINDKKYDFLYENLFDSYIELCKINKLEPRLSKEQFCIDFGETLSSGINYLFTVKDKLEIGMVIPFNSKLEPELHLLVVPTVVDDKPVSAYLLGPKHMINKEVEKLKGLYLKPEGEESDNFDGLDFFEKE